MKTVNIHRRKTVIVIFIGVCLLYMLWPRLWRMYTANLRPGSPVQTIADRAKLEGLGLKMHGGNFYLDGKKFKILSGAMHYFRIVPEYWKDRLMKLKAAGLNTVETYVPWNLHEEIKGIYNFDGMLNIRRFVELAAETGLYVIIRPGPYICAEWDFGGLPSWLLHDPNMKVRSTYPGYLEPAKAYIREVMKQIAHLQHHLSGPIIAFQIENEFGAYGHDQLYMESIMSSLQDSGATELLFTSDNIDAGDKGSLPRVLAMLNFRDIKDGRKLIDGARKKNPDWPVMVAEMWTGWFDHWGTKHNTWKNSEFNRAVRFILENDASINLYMFHGGTNFGFMNGANDGPYQPTITSYDYDAPLAESGEPRRKFFMLQKTLRRNVGDYIPKDVPPLPPKIPTFSYGMVKTLQVLLWNDILSLVNKPIISSENVVPMEMLNINNGGGQAHGFIVYRKVIKPSNKLVLSGVVRDRAVILLDGKEVDTVDWTQAHHITHLKNLEGTLDIVVENLGRVNYGSAETNVLNQQRKGLLHDVYLDNKKLTNWEIFPLDFKEYFMDKAQASKQWKILTTTPKMKGPALYRGFFIIDGKPKDTFLSTEGWVKGVAFINHFNLGRYWKKGPQKTLYIPAPLLKEGENEIVIFELHQPKWDLTLLERALLE